jgi:hypothetical protein
MARLSVTYVAAALCLVASVAQADWRTQTGQDPMTDKKWAAMSAPLNNSELPIVVKCWQGGDIQALIMVGRYEQSVTYKPTKTKIRIDKGEPFEILMSPINFNGAWTTNDVSEKSQPRT